MKGIISSVIIFFALSLILSAQPKLEIIGGDTYNWGQVKPGDSPLHTKMHLKNTGDKKLIISNVKPTCGCTTAPLDKSELNPGDTATLDITLRLPNSAGDVTKTIRITSNDSANPVKTIYLRANLFLDLEVGPTPYLTFDKMKVGFKSSASVFITNKTDKPIILSEITVTPEDLFINLHKTVTVMPKEKIELKAAVTPQKKGYFNCNVKMKTNNQNFPELNVMGYGNVEESPIFNN
jgi:hypothetical protein